MFVEIVKMISKIMLQQVIISIDSICTFGVTYINMIMQAEY